MVVELLQLVTELRDLSRQNVSIFESIPIDATIPLQEIDEVSVHGLPIDATITSNKIHSKSNIHLPQQEIDEVSVHDLPVDTAATTNDYADADENVKVLYDPSDAEDEVPSDVVPV
jgi:hypothetical protein